MCGSTPQEEAHRHNRFYPRPSEKHALEAPSATGTRAQAPHTHSFHYGRSTKTCASSHCQPIISFLRSWFQNSKFRHVSLSRPEASASG